MSDTVDWKKICPHVSYRFHDGKLTIRASSYCIEDLPGYQKTKIYQTFDPECVETIEKHLPLGEEGKEAMEDVIGRIGHSLLVHAGINTMAVQMFGHSGTTPLLAFDIIDANSMGTSSVILAACAHVDVGDTARRSYQEDSERLRRLFEDEDDSAGG